MNLEKLKINNRAWTRDENLGKIAAIIGVTVYCTMVVHIIIDLTYHGTEQLSMVCAWIIQPC